MISSCIWINPSLPGVWVCRTGERMWLWPCMLLDLSNIPWQRSSLGSPSPPSFRLIQHTHHIQLCVTVCETSKSSMYGIIAWIIIVRWHWSCTRTQSCVMYVGANRWAWSNSAGHTPQDYLDGELVPHFSSEPVPKPVKGALIRKVVGSNYLSEVGNTKKWVT